MGWWPSIKWNIICNEQKVANSTNNARVCITFNQFSKLRHFSLFLLIISINIEQWRSTHTFSHLKILSFFSFLIFFEFELKCLFCLYFGEFGFTILIIQSILNLFNNVYVDFGWTRHTWHCQFDWFCIYFIFSSLISNIHNIK